MRLKKAFLTLSLIILMCAALSCKKSPEYAARIEIIDGVENIFNPADPLHPQKTVAFEEELSIGSEDEEGNIILYQLGRFMVDDVGRMYITDSEEVVLKVFDEHGGYIRDIGKKGEGPGEYRAVNYMALLPDGRSLILDTRTRRTSLFSPEGEFQGSHNWQISLGQILWTTGSSFVARQAIYGEKQQVFIRQFNFSGEELLSYGEFHPGERKVIREKGLSIAMVVPYSPRSIFAGDQERQLLYHCLNSDYIVEVYANSGKMLRKIHKAHDPIPFTEDDRNEFYKTFENAPNPTFLELIKKNEKFPEYKSVTDRMQVDDRGNLWVRTFEKKSESGSEYTAFDIFNPDGCYEAKVWLEKRPDEFKKGKMYALETDEESGRRYLKRYRVIWSD